MGNYCCQAQQKIQNRHVKRVLKKKRSLYSAFNKKDYQQKLLDAFNAALSKFQTIKRAKSLIIKSQLGVGGQGTVYLVEIVFLEGQNLFKQNLAMKRISKKKLESQKTKNSLMIQRFILSNNDCQFLMQSQYTFQDNAYIYQLMKVAKGGDLFSFIAINREQINAKAERFKKLGQSGIRHILAGIIIGLQSLHDLGIVYRDLKLENILMGEDGYPELTDFGSCHKFQNESQLCYETKGTILYFSPEMQLKKGYNKSHDFWSLGILTYELCFMETPFNISMVKSPRFQAFVSIWKNKHKQNGYPSDFSPALIDFFNSLLEVDPKERLGYNCFSQVKNHAFFQGFDWENYKKKKLISPLLGLIDSYPLNLSDNGQFTDQSVDQQQYPRINVDYVKMNNDKKKLGSSVDSITTCHTDKSKKQYLIQI